MHFVLAVNYNIVEFMFALFVDGFLSLTEINLNVLSLVVVISLKAILKIGYLMRRRAVCLEQVMVAL